jgi:hypothetical protein
MTNWINPKDLAKIQYHGEFGITRSCLDAIVRLIHFGAQIEQVRLLTCGGYHCFLLKVATEKSHIAIKSGFSSGYQGEGPRGLSIALQLLGRYVPLIDEYEISLEVLQRISDSCLLVSDLEEINTKEQILPSRIHEYIYADGYTFTDDAINKRLRYEFPLVIPLRLVDCRITDLAIKFHEDPDSSLISAYRRLEDIIRKRTNLNNEIIGVKLLCT